MEVIEENRMASEAIHLMLHSNARINITGNLRCCFKVEALQFVEDESLALD